jgi:DNA-binding XRE family transcriptional regulator
MKRKNEIEKTFDESIAYLLRKGREKLGHSQDLVAQEADISRITLGKWERGEKTPNSFDLYNVLKVLKWEPEDFWAELGKHFEPTAKPLRIAAERTKIKAYIEQTKKKRA